jgi:hypothetical protein
MILISHRGNVDGIQGTENHPDYIDEAISKGFDVEIDVRKYRTTGLWLGHDSSTYQTDEEWLLSRKDNLWIHAKNFAALELLLKLNLRVFYHSKEQHSVIGNTHVIWSHNIIEATHNSIIPLLDVDNLETWRDMIGTTDVYGICSDYVGKW